MNDSGTKAAPLLFKLPHASSNINLCTETPLSTSFVSKLYYKERCSVIQITYCCHLAFMTCLRDNIIIFILLTVSLFSHGTSNGMCARSERIKCPLPLICCRMNPKSINIRSTFFLELFPTNKQVQFTHVMKCA